jgi:hypothetical protein
MTSSRAWLLRQRQRSIRTSCEAWRASCDAQLFHDEVTCCIVHIFTNYNFMISSAVYSIYSTNYNFTIVTHYIQYMYMLVHICDINKACLPTAVRPLTLTVAFW